MTKVRVGIFFFSLFIILALAIAASLYVRGYRLDTNTFRLMPNGLLVANSDPNGAQVFINGELKTATNNTISLSPRTYDVLIKKEGFLPWQKRLVIEKEIVTQIDVVLFPAAPSLSALTFSGVFNPQISPDLSKIAYAVVVNSNAGLPADRLGLPADKAGLWLTELVDLPIGFRKEPRQITDGDLSGANWEWSPDSREILLTTGAGLSADRLGLPAEALAQAGVFLLKTGDFTPQNQRVNITNQVDKILSEWNKKKEKRLQAQLAKLPDELEDIFKRKASNIQFSPDEKKILYTASASAFLPEGLIKPLPGSSTQKQKRNIKPGKKYVYDTKEDRNFGVSDADQVVYWFPTSRHLILPKKDKIMISDYDATNLQAIYSGSYVAPHAYPFANGSKLLILTNLGANSAPPNLYFLSLK